MLNALVPVLTGDRYDIEYSGPFYPTMSFIRSICSVQKESDDKEAEMAKKEEQKKDQEAPKDFPFVLGTSMAYV